MALEATPELFDSFGSPYHQPVFLQEIIPQTTGGRNLSFTILENRQPLAIVPLFEYRRWRLRFGKMSPQYAAGPAFQLGNFSGERGNRLVQRLQG